MMIKKSSGKLLGLSLSLVTSSSFDGKLGRGKYLETVTYDPITNIKDKKGGVFINWYTVFNRNPIFMLFASLIGVCEIERNDFEDIEKSLVFEEVVEKFYLKR